MFDLSLWYAVYWNKMLLLLLLSTSSTTERILWVISCVKGRWYRGRVQSMREVVMRVRRKNVLTRIRRLQLVTLIGVVFTLSCISALVNGQMMMSSRTLRASVRPALCSCVVCPSFRSSVRPSVTKLVNTIFWQKAQLSQISRAMFCVIEYFAKSLKVT